MKKHKRLYSLLVVVGLLVGVSGGIFYTGMLSTSSEPILNVSSSVANHNEDSIIDHSDAIIRGVVVDVSDFQDNSDAYYRTQNVSVEVNEALKGNISVGSIINIQINSYEGVHDVNVISSEELPTFSVNEDVVLFLVEYNGDYIISGVNQGAFYLDKTLKTVGETFKHKTKIGNDFEQFNYSRLLDKLQ